MTDKFGVFGDRLMHYKDVSKIQVVLIICFFLIFWILYKFKP
jgi:hypothetical protein